MDRSAAISLRHEPASPSSVGGEELAAPELRGIWSAIGATPLVQLERLWPELGCRFYAKLEFMNPGGSAKDRAAFRMVSAAIKSGALAAGGLVVESTSGNMGIALAQACKFFGLRLVCVVDYRTTLANRRILELYGAEVDLVPETRDPLRARIARVQERVANSPGAFWPNQYENENNPGAHAEGTALEIARALGRAPDVLFCPVSTCGTIVGLDQGLSSTRGGQETRIFAVDLVGSVLFADAPGVRLIPGIGSSRKRHFDVSKRVHPIHVTERDCVRGCWQLLEREAIFAGGSSGAVVAAVEQVQSQVAPDTIIVLILADRGDRYLDSIYSDKWLTDHAMGRTDQPEDAQP